MKFLDMFENLQYFILTQSALYVQKYHSLSDV